MGAPKIPPEFRFNSDMLSDLSHAAFENAAQLISEAKLLLSNQANSRAYFLAVAAIEEIGKAYICFDSISRNLQDSAVTAKVKKMIESHSSKINSAFHASIQSASDPRTELETAIDLMINLGNGREPSMYTDINYLDSKIYTPTQAVREKAANDCVRLAEHCYSRTLIYTQNKVQTEKSKYDDQVFGINSNTYNKMLSNEDYWWYLLDNFDKNHSEVTVRYHQKYLSKGKRYKETDEQHT